LLDSSIAAARVGPKTRSPRSWSASERERKLRADNGKAGLFFNRQANECFKVLEIDRNAAGNLGDAAISGCAYAFAALNCPSQRVFATA
jgi:hypothetical protein